MTVFDSEFERNLFALRQEKLKAIIGDLPDLATVDQIRLGLPSRLKDTSPHRLASCLKSLGAREAGRIRLDGKRPHVWALRNHAAYDDLSEGHRSAVDSRARFIL